MSRFSADGGNLLEHLIPIFRVLQEVIKAQKLKINPISRTESLSTANVKKKKRGRHL